MYTATARVTKLKSWLKPLLEQLGIPGQVREVKMEIPAYTILIALL